MQHKQTKIHWRGALVTTTWWVAKLPMLWRCGILHRISAHNSAKDRVVNVQEYTASSEIVIRRDLRMHYFPGSLGIERHSALSRGFYDEWTNVQTEYRIRDWKTINMEVATCRDNVMSSTFLTLQETSMSQTETGNWVAVHTWQIIGL